jgi:MFS family permease
MNPSRTELDAAVNAGVLRPEQLEPLIEFLKSREKQDGRARFNGANVLYYLGGMLAIGAATLFATIALEQLGMGALLALVSFYALFSVLVAIWFEQRGHGVLAGIFATLAIALTPLAIYALQHLLGYWADGSGAEHYRDFHRYIDWRWLLMELGTLVAGGLMLVRFRYPFMIMPRAVTLWYLGMDIIPALMLGADDGAGAFSGAGWELRKKITLAYGVVMLLSTLWFELRYRPEKDYGFWPYLFGMLTFWGALSSMGDGALAGKLFYLLINFGLVLAGAILVRRVFTVFGGIGLLMGLGNLSWGLFGQSLAFGFVLTLVGFALIGVGIWWNKHERQIAHKLSRHLSKNLRDLASARQA